MIERLCPAKINLFLRVLGKRADGYHELETLFQEIDLADRLCWHPGPEPITLDVGQAQLGNPQDNLVMRAAVAFSRATSHRVGGRMVLHKQIPAGGGLGGGSSDAAGVLRLLNDYHGGPLDEDDLGREALALGSDVPFFLHGGCKLGRGRGEQLSNGCLPAGPRGGFLLFPGIHLATPSVFRAYGDGVRPLREDRPGTLGENHLLPAALSVSPRFARIWKALVALLGVDFLFMSGSGSTCVWLCEEKTMDPERAEVLASLGVRYMPFDYANS